MRLSDLKTAPKGTRLYSPIFGECELCEIEADGTFEVRNDDGGYFAFSSDGKMFSQGEVMLFPSKGEDWEPEAALH